MNPPTFTADEARLLLDHLDNVQAASLPDDEWRAFRLAKMKLLDLETFHRGAATDRRQLAGPWLSSVRVPSNDRRRGAR